MVPDSSLLAALLASSDDGIVVWGVDRRIVVWNASATLALGYAASEAIGSSADLLLQDETAELATGPQLREVRDKHGNSVVLSIHLSPLQDAAGLTVGWLARFRAIEAEGSDWNAERLSLVLAAAQLGDWTWDAASDVVTFSERAAQLFAVRAGPHMTWAAMRELIHPGDREPAQRAAEEAMAQRTDLRIEYRLINGGRERWASVSGRSRYDASGHVVGMYGVVQDITSDRLLLRLDDAVRTLVKPEDITSTTARIVGQALDVNRCAYAFVDADEDTFSLTGGYTNGVANIVGSYRFRQFGAECLRLMRAGEPYVVTDSASDRRIDEEDRRAYELTKIRAVICVPILKSGRFVGAMAVHSKAPRSWSTREVELVQQVASRCWESIERARVELERERLLLAAESANRVKDEFLAMLGHELRNPLAPIQTALELMKLKGNALCDRERTVIERQVTHLTRLIDDLLDVSRIARGRVVLKLETIELAEIVSRAVEVASPLLEQRAHSLVLDVPARGLPIEGDVARLIQVVSNLLTNAGKYTPPGGRITLTARSEEGPSGSEVVLSVRDTGVGIAPDVLPHVFDLFVQARQTIDRAQGGLGLGLTIVRNLVQSHGGRVSAHSEGVDKGSEFIVRLPRASSAATPRAKVATPVPIPASPAQRAARVLVVDDNEDAAELLATVLALRGCDVQVAHDGPEALQIGAARPFDLALLDIGLPVMDGYELAARLKELPNLSAARFVAVTGYGQPSDRERSRAAGFDHHLIKPVDVAALDRLMAPQHAP